MDIKDYINSGILELYVAGSLSEKESQEVYVMTQKHPEILAEVLKIEAAIITLTAAVSPSDISSHFRTIKNSLSDKDASKLTDLNTSPKNTSWFTYIGWAASVLLAAGLLWMIDQNNTLKEQLQTVETDKHFLEEQIEIARTDLNEATTLLSVLRDRSILKIPLAGQAASLEAYASVYWDKTTNNIYLDAEGLPDPPQGKVYQVWSLTLDPLTPTSLGTIDNFITDTNKIFAIKNNNTSEAFGITLEPVGGSKTPTLEQLYTLGTVKSTP